MTRAASGLLLGVLVAAVLAACAADSGPQANQPAEEAAGPATLRIGVLATEDVLPLWVAQEGSAFEDAGVDVTVEQFETSDERDAAMQAGQLDLVAADIVTAARLTETGDAVRIVSVTLGAVPDEGRVGIVAPPGGFATLEQLDGGTVGVPAGTVQEYVLDRLASRAGIPVGGLDTDDVPSTPIRFERLMTGELDAAVLPEPFLTLAEQEGAVLIADDANDENLSQAVLVARDAYLSDPAGREATVRLLDVWEATAREIDTDPEAHRNLLVERADIPDQLASDYPVPAYPPYQTPTEQQVSDVLDWMKERGYLDLNITYDQLVWDRDA